MQTYYAKVWQHNIRLYSIWVLEARYWRPAPNGMVSPPPHVTHPPRHSEGGVEDNPAACVLCTFYTSRSTAPESNRNHKEEGVWLPLPTYLLSYT